MQRTSSLALDPHARRPRLTSLREQVPLLDLHDPAHPSSSPPWSPSRPPATCGCTGPFVRGATAPQIGATLCRLPRFVRHGRCHSLGRRGCHRGRPRRRHGRVEGRSKPPLLGDDRSANAPPRRRPSLVHERRLRPVHLARPGGLDRLGARARPVRRGRWTRRASATRQSQCLDRACGLALCSHARR